MNVVLPPAFGLDADALDFDWVPHPVRGAMWANYQLMDLDKGDENFSHMVPVSPLEVFRMDPGDQVWQSALRIHPVSPPWLMFQMDLTQCGVGTRLRLSLCQLSSGVRLIQPQRLPGP